MGNEGGVGEEWRRMGERKGWGARKEEISAGWRMEEGQRVSVEWRMGGEGWRMGNTVEEDEGGRWWWSIEGANISKVWAVQNVSKLEATCRSQLGSVRTGRLQ